MHENMPEDVRALVDQLAADNPEHEVLSINCAMRLVEAGVEFHLDSGEGHKAYVLLDRDAIVGDGPHDVDGLLTFFQFLDNMQRCIQTVMEQNMENAPSGSVYVIKDGETL